MLALYILSLYVCVSLLVRISFVLNFHECVLPPSTSASGLSSYRTVFIQCQFISLITIINKAFDTSYYKVNWDKSEAYPPVSCVICLKYSSLKVDRIPQLQNRAKDPLVQCKRSQQLVFIDWRVPTVSGLLCSWVCLMSYLGLLCSNVLLMVVCMRQIVH